MFFQVATKNNNKKVGALATPKAKTATAAESKTTRGDAKRQGSRSTSRGRKGSDKTRAAPSKRGRDKNPKPKPQLSAAAAQQFLAEKAQHEAWKSDFPPKSMTCTVCSAVEVISTLRQVSDAERFLARGGGLPEYDLCGSCIRTQAVTRRLRMAKEEALRRDLDIVHSAPSKKAAVQAENRRVRAEAQELVERLAEEAEGEEELKEFRNLALARANAVIPELMPVEVNELTGINAEEFNEEDAPRGAAGLVDGNADLPEPWAQPDVDLAAEEGGSDGVEAKAQDLRDVVDWNGALRLVAPIPSAPLEDELKEPPLPPPPTPVARVPLNPPHVPKAKGAVPLAPAPYTGGVKTEVPERQSRYQIEMALREKYMMLDYTPYDTGGAYRPIECNTTLLNLKAKLINKTSTWKTFSDECLLQGIRRGRIAVPKSMMASIKLKYATFEFKKAANEADHEQNFKQLRHNAGMWFQRAFFDYTGVQVAGGDVGARVTPHFFQQNDPQPVGLNE